MADRTESRGADLVLNVFGDLLQHREAVAKALQIGNDSLGSENQAKEEANQTRQRKKTEQQTSWDRHFCMQNRRILASSTASNVSFKTRCLVGQHKGLKKKEDEA